MLNRIYIVVGLLAILALGAAFIVPRFIQWGEYRERMEVLAAGVFGAEVDIRGDVAFALLPQPQLRFSDVSVGDPAAPVLTVGTVEAEFSLMDFLTDRYTITRLVLERPVLDLSLDAGGTIFSRLAEAPAGGQSNVSIASARIVEGQLRLRDTRADGAVTVERVDGDLRIGSLRGPFQFQGAGVVDFARYRLRFNSGPFDATGTTRVSLFTQPEDGGFSVTSEGSFLAGENPRYEGTLVYRQSPTDVEGDVGRGDLVLESQIRATPASVLLTTYTLVPDENRPGTRLTGAAEVRLGERPEFSAVISGGVLSLPPRDATEEQSGQPYEVLRLLAELSEPTIIPLPGSLNVDIAEVDLRALSLRDVRLDAVSDGKAWRIDTFLARLPGDTSLKVTGQLAAVQGRSTFSGHASLASDRLNALAQLWRDPAETEILFNQPATLETDIALLGDRLDFTELQFTLGKQTHLGSVGISFGPERRLDVALGFAALDRQGSAAISALLPPAGTDPTFAASFPQGTIAVEAAAASLFGVEGRGLAASGSWGGAGLKLDRLAAEDFGGIGVDLGGVFAGTLAAPVLSGSGRVRVASGDAAALDALHLALGTPVDLRELVERSAPADLTFELGTPIAGGGQRLGINGQMNHADVNLEAQLAGGLTGLLNSPIAAVLSITGEQSGEVARQLGLPESAVFTPDQPLDLSIRAEGTLANSLDLRLDALSGEDNVAFNGNAVLAGTGADWLEGSIVLGLGDGSGLADLIGAPGIFLPALQASATLAIDPEGRLAATEIQGASGGQAFTGEISVDPTTGRRVVDGRLDLEAMELPALAALLGGPAATATLEGGIWPDVPFLAGGGPRQTTGSVAVTTSWLPGGVPAPVTFELVWDETETRIRAFRATLGGGSIEGDLAFCCAGPLSDRQLSGRLTVTGAPVDLFLPETPAQVLGGEIDWSAQFTGMGGSVAALVGSLSGEGSFTARHLTIERFAPAVFPTVAGLENLADLSTDALSNIAALAVEKEAFVAPEVQGAFTLAGGTLRLANVGAEGAGGRVFGGLSLRLSDLTLGGSFTMTPVGVVDPEGVVSDATSQITATLAGTLLAPVATLDLASMVAAVQLRVNELELDRLERVRLEDEARSRAAAEERNRLIAEQRRQREAEEAARRAEEARIAAELEAARLAAEQAAAREGTEAPGPAEPTDTTPFQTTPFDLGLPPPNQTF